MAQLVFITGTDTAVGKTVLTALLLSHLRRTGRQAVALKPFCSGSRADARLLYSLQAPVRAQSKIKITLDQINPFHFPEPIAPLAAARRHGRRIRLQEALERLRALTKFIDAHPKLGTQNPKPKTYLLVEGAGGLLAPLGEDFTFLDLITHLKREPPPRDRHPGGQAVFVVAPNRLGTLNHCLLTVRTLQAAGLQNLSVVLMGRRKPDASAATNRQLLAEWLAPVPVHALPYLGRNCRTRAALIARAATLRPVLKSVLG